MLNAYTIGATIANGAYVPFTTISLVKGGTAELSGTTSIQLNKAGVYMVTANITGLPAANGNARVAMLKDGVEQDQATAVVTGVASTLGVTLPINTLVQVPHNNGLCCCTSPTVLSFENQGVGLNQADATITVTRIC